MGDDIDCCRRPTNLGKKDLKTYRGINQKNNPKLPISNFDGPDNFDSFKQPKNLEKKSNKKGNTYLNSVYDNENDSKFPKFSEFDIEPVNEPLYQEPISQPQYGNAQYIDSNPVITQQNQIIQDNNYINSTEQFTQPQTQITQIQNQFQTGFDVSNYDKNIQNNYIPSSNMQDFTNDTNTVNITTQPVEYISSSTNNITSQAVEYINSPTNQNITNITSQQYDNYQNVLPPKYIQIEKPVIYANNIPNQSDITKYVESSSNIQTYQEYNISNISSTNYIDQNSTPVSTASPQYYESNNEINYLPPKIETVINSTQVYTGVIPNAHTSEIQYSNYPQEILINEQKQQIYYSQQPKEIYLEPQSQIDNNEYVQQKKGPSDSGHKKPKKLKKRRKIIEYYVEDDDEEEEENDEEEEPSSSIYDEIKEQKLKNKKVKVKYIKKSRRNDDEEDIKNIKIKNKKNKKQIMKSLEDKENESDNMEHERSLTQNQIKVLEKNQKIEKIEEIKEIERDEEEFSGFQKEPEMIRESLENSDNNFDDIFENRIKNLNNNLNNEKNEKKIISLKNGNKIVGNFKQEEILDKNEMAEKERNELFSGKTLKVVSVEKKEESNFCQVPGFISNIFSKIF